MSAYLFVDVREVTDPDKLAAYRAGVLETVEAHGGRYLVLGGPAEVVEGDWPIGMPVIVEFPSRAVAEGWYRSEAYKPLLELRLQATKGAALLIDGCEHPPATLVAGG